MKKVVVAEIGKSTIVLNAFGSIENRSLRLLGQVVTRTGLNSGLTLLEKDIGPLDGEDVETYILSSLNPKTFSQEIPKVVPTDQAILHLSGLFLEEIGDVLILDVGGGSTDIYLFQRSSLRIRQGLGVYQDAKKVVALIGEQEIKVRYGPGWEALVKPIPKTAEEIALGRELAAYALQKAMLDFCRLEASQAEPFQSALDLAQLRWVIGTGGALVHLPGGLEMINEALSHCQDVHFPEGGFPVLLDRDNILASLGVLMDEYRDGVWQLLLESLGVDS